MQRYLIPEVLENWTSATPSWVTNDSNMLKWTAVTAAKPSAKLNAMSPPQDCIRPYPTMASSFWSLVGESSLCHRCSDAPYHLTRLLQVTVTSGKCASTPGILVLPSRAVRNICIYELRTHEWPSKDVISSGKFFAMIPELPSCDISCCPCLPS